MSEKQPSAGFSPEQLSAVKEMLVAVLAEARKPADLTPEQLAIKEQEKAMRKQQGEYELSIKEGRKQEQKRCSHRQPNGQSAVTPVENLGFIICAHCQAMIKPAPGPFDEGQFIYDENLYWSLLGSRSTTTF